MRFDPPLLSGRLIRRYQRFLADVELVGGQRITAHCPNSGSMKTCSTPGSAACVSANHSPARKLRYTLELVRSGRHWVGVHTGRTNRVVEEAIRAGRVPELAGYPELRGEVRCGEHSRLDFVLAREGEQCFIEVKSVSLVEHGVARFPDAVTERGTKHLLELMRLRGEGNRAVIFFLVQRADAHGFEPAADIDPVYAATLAAAHRAGVQVLVYRARVSPRELRVVGPLPWVLSRT